jgi:hypothetical protein
MNPNQNSRSHPQSHPIAIGLAYLNNKEPPSQTTWELFRYFRSEIQHEHSLLMGRVAWYITCQSFLITVYAVSFGAVKRFNWFSNILLPTLAITISILAYFMIQGATTTINMWGELRRDLINFSTSSRPGTGLDPILIQRWRSDFGRDAIHQRALWFPQFITIIFMVFWIVVSLLSWRSPWIR